MSDEKWYLILSQNRTTPTPPLFLDLKRIVKKILKARSPGQVYL
jgi:hypothetical protein